MTGRQNIDNYTNSGGQEDEVRSTESFFEFTLSVCLPASLSLRFGRLVIKEGAGGGVFLRCVAEALQKALRFC